MRALLYGPDDKPVISEGEARYQLIEQEINRINRLARTSVGLRDLALMPQLADQIRPLTFQEYRPELVRVSQIIVRAQAYMKRKRRAAMEEADGNRIERSA